MSWERKYAPAGEGVSVPLGMLPLAGHGRCSAFALSANASVGCATGHTCRLCAVQMCQRVGAVHVHVRDARAFSQPCRLYGLDAS